MALKSFYCYFLVIFVHIIATHGDEWNHVDYLKKEHSLVRPYQGSGMTIPNWDFVGSTMVTERYIRLTPDIQSKQGAIWNKVPVIVPAWELHVQFKVHGHGKDLYGDGFAIWYAKESLQLGPVFGSKDKFHGLGIFFDTYANQNGPHAHNHPYISAMINNGTQEYDHDRDGTHTELAGCEVKMRNVDHDTYVSIRYENDRLTLSTDFENNNQWKECFSVTGVQLPTGYFFGASAATGELSDHHDIIFMKLYELDVPESERNKDRSNIIPAAMHFAPHRDHVDDPAPSGGGLWAGVKLLFTLVIIMLIIGGLAIVGYMLYQKQEEKSRKRFY